MSFPVGHLSPRSTPARFIYGSSCAGVSPFQAIGQFPEPHHNSGPRTAPVGSADGRRVLVGPAGSRIELFPDSFLCF